MSENTTLRSLMLSVVAGILLALSYPQFNFSLLAWFALVPLLFAIENKNLFQSFVLGWLAGFVMFIGQIFWLEVFHFSVPFALSFYLALYFGLFCLLYQLLKGRARIPSLAIIPLLWVAVEYVRSIGTWGFPAGLLGYSQHQNILLIQIADLVGIFGVSFLVVFINASIFSIIKNFSYNRALKIALPAFLVLVLVLLYGGVKLGSAGVDKDLRVALIQNNLEVDVEYRSSEVIGTLSRLTARAAKEKLDLVIWPETVVRESARLAPVVSAKINNIVKRYGSYLIFGNPDIKRVGGKMRHYNSAFLVSPGGKVMEQYDKIHPVPFWEVFPARYYLGFLRNTEAKGTYDRGQEFTVFNMPKGKFSVLICFEGIFSGLARKFVKNGAQFLVNITNDRWSRSAAEHYQHASMNVFRAVENRIYYVRVGNSGVTEVIDPYGRINSSLPLYKEGYLVADIGLRKGLSVYTRLGDYFGYLSALLALGMILVSRGKVKNEA